MTNQPAPPKTPNTPDAKPVTSALRAGRDFIMVIGGAVAIALLIKSFVFDVYLIPSGSMETALHGRPDGGDRILASKLNYHFRPPRRWEVAVFEFPYESARRNDPSANPESYRGQNFVKRIVGMPGESLAIARGDIWTRPDHDPGAPFQRQVKPDTVQQGIWLNVAQEDFQDITAAELATFWNFPDNGSVQVDPEAEALQLTPGEKEVSISYRPQIPVGEKRDNLVELRGIPDRYVLEQPIQFRCRAILEDGSVCSHVFVKSFTAQNIQARCPVCGTMANELSSIFYHRRSGLTASGRYRVSPSATTQGEEVAPRQAD
ncbi:MAG: signal peptidase I [Planctomycetota bacterium]|nr:signal peptidase I [Planctomycetota bacterium]